MNDRKEAPGPAEPSPEARAEAVCPVCGAALVQQQCKVFCSRCHHLVFNCSEF